MTVLSEPLIRHLGEQAPGCSLALDPVDVGPGQFETQLLRRDLIIGPLGFEFPGRTQPVFTDHLVCVVDESNPRLRNGALTVEDLQEMPHAVAAFGAAGDRRRPLEVAMDAAGVGDRNVLVQVTSLLVLPFAVSGTDMCAFVPSRLARRCLDILGLAVAETPLEPVQITEAAHWHPRRDSEPAVVWLRQLLYDVAVSVEDELTRPARGRRPGAGSRRTRARTRSPSPPPGPPPSPRRRGPTSGETTAPRANWEKPRIALPAPATGRTSAIASAAALPMIPPLLSTATKIGSGSSPGRCVQRRRAPRTRGCRRAAARCWPAG